MTRHICVTLVGVAVLMTGVHAATRIQGGGATASSAAAAAAAKSSPELVGALSKELSATPEQAAGAAGALFGVAKSRLKPEEFSQVSKSVPGMSSLLKAAPAMGAVGTSGMLSQMAGSAGGGAEGAAPVS